jgi:transcriptional antiterminator NusG
VSSVPFRTSFRFPYYITFCGGAQVNLRLLNHAIGFLWAKNQCLKRKSYALIFASVSWEQWLDIVPAACVGGIRNASGEAVSLTQRRVEHMAWYAIHVATGREDAVCEEIRREVDTVGYDKDYRLFVPKRKLLETKEGETHEVLRTMFSGYVLVQTDEVREFAKIALKAKGIFRFLENDGMVQEIQVEEIALVLQMVEDDDVIGVSEIETDEFGFLRVISGPLKGLEGQIRKVDKYRHRAKVEVKFDFDGAVYEVWLGVRMVEMGNGDIDRFASW